MHERFSRRIEEGLQSLGRRIEKSQKVFNRGDLERQIGRLLGQNSRAAARYSISLLEDTTTPAGVKLKWNIRAVKLPPFFGQVAKLKKSDDNLLSQDGRR
jgi:hypothetical protein